MMVGSSQFWSAAFFLMLISIGIGSEVSHLIAITTIVHDTFPILNNYKGW